MKIVVKLSALLFALLFILSVFMSMPTTVVFAGFTPTPTNEPATPIPPPTETPVPAPTSDSGDSGTPVEMTPTPVPTPEAIPELGGGPGSSQMSMMGMTLLGIFFLLAFAWWRAWQLYQNQER